MFNILPLIIIFICLIVLVAVIVRKFPQLSRMQTHSMQKEKESEAKKRILHDRLKRKTEKFSSGFGGAFKKVSSSVATSLKGAQEQLESKKKELNKQQKPEKIETPEEQKQQEQYEEYIEQELEEAEEMAEKRDNFEKAEKKYIDIIAEDPKNVEAYEGLGELYYDYKKFDEAREIFTFILKLDAQNAHAHYDLSYIDFFEGLYDNAMKHLKNALEIEPRNPKFLAHQIEVAIKQNDKVTAQMALQKLKEVNPENARIDEYKNEIKEL